MKKNHFVTGATGFVGGAIVLELLKKTKDDIYCLVRGENIENCDLRLKKALSLCSLAFDEQLEDEIQNRCHAVQGDLHSINLPIAIEQGNIQITHVWHSAASLKFAERDKNFIHKTNVAGTQYICELSNKLNVDHFNYISTAYVSGKTEGKINEKTYPLDNITSNYYETSKIIAENHLLEHCKAKIKILRPSIVIGHSKTLVPTSFSGMYGFIIDLNIFKNKVEEQLGALLYHRSLKILSVPKDPLNLIPIDYVADAAVRIGLSDSSELVFHLTNDTPVQVGDGIEIVFERLKLQRPLFVSDENMLTEIDRKLDDNLDFYSSYLKGVKIFDRKNALSVEGVYNKGFQLDKTILSNYIYWYMDYMEVGGKRSRLEQKYFEKKQLNQIV